MFKIFPKFLGKKREPLTFLDIGNANIKLVSLDSQLRIKKIDFLPIPEIEPELGELPKSKEHLIVETVRRLLARNKDLSATVYSLLSDRAVFTRVFKLFPMPARDIEKAVRYEVKLQAPFAVERSQIFFFVLQKVVEKNVSKNEVLSILVPQDVIDNFSGYFQKAELNLKVLDLSYLALWRLFLKNYPHLLNKTVALLDIGASKTEVSIVKNGNLCFSRIIPVGGQDFTRAIKEELNVETSEAENLKREYGSAHRMFLGFEEDKEQLIERIYLSLAPLLNQFLNDLRRSFDFYLEQFPSAPVQQVILTGGGSNLKEIEEFISENFNKIPVEKFKLTEGLIASPEIDKDSKEIFKNQELLQLFVPLLGLLSWESSKARVNLMAIKLAPGKKPGITFNLSQLMEDPIIRWFFLIGIFFVLVVFLSVFFIFRMEKMILLEKKRIEERESVLTVEKAKIQAQLEGKNMAYFRLLQSIISQKRVPLNEMIEVVSRSVNKGIFLNKMVIDSNLKQLEISGDALDNESVSNFLEKLDKNKEGQFSKVELIFIKEGSNLKFKKNFKIIAELI